MSRAPHERFDGFRGAFRHHAQHRRAVIIGERTARPNRACLDIDFDAPACRGFDVRFEGARVEAFGDDKGRAAFLEAPDRFGCDAHKRFRFHLLKAIVHEPVAKRVRRVLKARRRGKSIGAV